MKLVLNSVSYHNCPVHVREKVAFTAEQCTFLLSQMHAEDAVAEAVILNTCNRTEFYTYVKKTFEVSEFITALISRISPESADTWKKFSRSTTDIDVVRHLFSVAAGLDSQMLGENQVLSQVKAAYALSVDCRMSKFVFHRLFHSAFRAGKAVRTHTGINCGAVSISLAAVQLAKENLSLPSASALLIGAGENAELAATYLLKAGLTNLTIANRNARKAHELAARLKTGRVIALEDAPQKLAEVDLLVSSTAAAEPVITCPMVEDYLTARTRDLLIIDIAVPRDIDPGLARFGCVRLHNIDDLDELINKNRQKRTTEIPKAKAIVDDFTNKFTAWLDSLNLVPVITQLTQKGLELAVSEARRYAKDFSEDQDEKLQIFAQSLVRKILHGPVTFLKTGSDEEPTTEQLQAADLINKMFLSQPKSDK